jgi:hypothetical protein
MGVNGNLDIGYCEAQIINDYSRLPQELLDVTATSVSVNFLFSFLYLCKGGSRDGIKYIVSILS